MTSVTQKDREFTIQFIRRYKLLPALWNTKSESYRDNALKQKCYLVLLKKYREHYPKASLSDMKRKLNSLRSNFRKYTLRKPGGPSPNLYWYNEMKFVLGNEEVENEIDVDATYDALKCEEMEISGADSSYDQEEDHLKDVEHLEIAESDLTFWQNDDNPSPPPQVSRTEKFTPKLIYKESEQTSMHDEDEYDLWGRVMAAELRKLNARQQIFAKKAITDVLLEGQLGLLNRDSVQINKGHGSEI
ncbi:uncharacterized protein LOC125225274 [Leguminivora glycinivorella]|uniref:uncharacterized protein LOC125225274 n=1 Tax=Leguminivora glycinivorella TaxID=1035111 RepID=UPI00200D989A|nr:uncharacterized protein LOC125225274 [Leguminivora glycinivorella]